MAHSTFTRRQINFGLAAIGSLTIVHRARAAEINLVHTHGLPVESLVHKRRPSSGGGCRATRASM
jgi:hypothetical protein